MTEFNPLPEPPKPMEDLEHHWGFVDWEGKVVLDIGADYGSTAYFFLTKGAKKIIAVEPHHEHRYLDLSYYPRLCELAKKLPQIHPVAKFITHAEDFEELLLNHDVDVVKVDCEGCEVFLLEVEPGVLRRASEYVIELHPARGYPITIERDFGINELKKRLRERFKTAGFCEVRFFGFGGGILHFKRVRDRVQRLGEDS